MKGHAGGQRSRAALPLWGLDGMWRADQSCATRPGAGGLIEVCLGRHFDRYFRRLCVSESVSFYLVGIIQCCLRY